MTETNVRAELLRKYLEEQHSKEIRSQELEEKREAATTMESVAEIPSGKIAYSQIGEWASRTKGIDIPGWHLPAGKPDFGVTVYDREEWAEEVRQFIPTYKTHFFPDSHYEVVYGIENDSTTMIRGRPGTGKTSGVEAWCGIIGMPYARVSCHEEVTLENFVGSKTLVSNGDGHSTIAPVFADMYKVAKHGGVVCIDELPVSPQGVILAMFPTFEQPRKIDVTAISCGEHLAHLLPCHEDFRVVITGNTGGGGDIFGDYAGVNQQNKALLDRIDVMIEMDYLPKQHEISLLTAMFPDVNKAAIERVVDFSAMLRNGFATRSLTLPWSLRGITSWIKGFRHYGNLGVAFKTLLLPKYEKKDEQDAIKVMWQTTFGEDM